jgi:DNA-directed RNA polymerase specialized sigma24 family protein
MTDQHPITPPPELQEQWWKQEWLSVRPSLTSFHEWMLAKSAQWGYDQRGEVNEAKLQKARDEELEACYGWLVLNCYGEAASRLRDARRPKPPSLKKQALKTLEEAPGPDYPRAMTVLNADQHALIRKALKALPDD